MEQTSIVRNLATWITANPWHPLLTVLYDLCSYGVQRGALYMGEREKGRGRQTQVAQTDILVRREDCRTVELVVELDFRKNKNGDLVAPRPKDLIGLLLAPAAADNYTPSNKYRLRDAIIVVGTAYAMRAYIVVAVGPGKSRDVARQIASLPGVKMAAA
jgi:hypothetical protein